MLKIELPPLRERREDIPALITHFLSVKAPGRTIKLDSDVVRLLEEYGWPGNVRGLENVIERACVHCDDERITRNDLPDEIRCAADGRRRTEIITTSGDGLFRNQPPAVADAFWEALKGKGFKLWKIVDMENVRK